MVIDKHHNPLWKTWSTQDVYSFIKTLVVSILYNTVLCLACQYTVGAVYNKWVNNNVTVL
ncbi:hypothetical protein MASR2M48_05170 [Spirochaetota bacterium]